MARDDTLTIPANAWTQLTNSDATNVTFQVKRGSIQLTATAGAVQPTDFTKAIDYVKGEGEINIALAGLRIATPGVNRLWAFANADSADVYISHD